jgi:phage terminase large subunit
MGQTERDGRLAIVPYDPALKVHTVFDLGKGANMAVVFYQKGSLNPRMIDYWIGKENEGLPTAIKEIQRKPYVYGKHFAPHDIAETELGTQKTRWETARELGVIFDPIPNVSIAEGINAGQLFPAKLWVDKERCEEYTARPIRG